MRIFSFMLMVMLVVLTGCITDKPDPNAYIEIPIDKPRIIMAAHYAVEQEQYALNHGMGRRASKLKLLEITKAEQQMGENITYRLQLRVTLDSEELGAETVVGWEKWGSPSQFKMVSWDFKN
ncbi:hypothetical protein [Desulfogranum japonicum]|uniref:hypothetical protein n=1 Tax=Desulfogranum japonicum TaxID=231447 RepID=UPI0004073A5A|nr:hypothetical protein [Desulfogranum japonicum]